MSLIKYNLFSKYLIIKIYLDDNNYKYINTLFFDIFNELSESKFWYILKIKEENYLNYFIYNHNNNINIRYFDCLFKKMFILKNNIHRNINVYFGCQTQKIFNSELEKYNNYNIKYYIKKDKWKHIYTHPKDKKIETTIHSNLIKLIKN